MTFLITVHAATEIQNRYIVKARPRSVVAMLSGATVPSEGIHHANSVESFFGHLNFRVVRQIPAVIGVGRFNRMLSPIRHQPKPDSFGIFKPQKSFPQIPVIVTRLSGIFSQAMKAGVLKAESLVYLDGCFISLVDLEEDVGGTAQSHLQHAMDARKLQKQLGHPRLSDLWTISVGWFGSFVVFSQPTIAPDNVLFTAKPCDLDSTVANLVHACSKCHTLFEIIAGFHVHEFGCFPTQDGHAIKFLAV